MRARVVACAGLMAGMAVLLAEPAWAAGGVQIDPSPAGAGQQVTVRATCDNESDTAVAYSAAFNTVKSALTGANRFVSPATIKSGLAPDTYSVTVRCESGTKLYGSVTVTRKATRKRPRREPSYPYDGAMTGGGGAQGPGLPGAWTSAGLALMLGAAGVGGMAFYRARARGRS